MQIITPPQASPSKTASPELGYRTIPGAPSGPIQASEASQALATGLRSVGPGRLERGYQRQIAHMRMELEGMQSGVLTLEKSLDTAHLIERGTERYVDRMEEDLRGERAQAKRVMVLVGSLQQENEHWRSEVARLEARLNRIASTPRGAACGAGLPPALRFGRPEGRSFVLVPVRLPSTAC